MTDDDLKALCDKAERRIQQIPYSDWPEPGLVAGVLYDVCGPELDRLTKRVAELERLLKRHRHVFHVGSVARSEIDSALETPCT